MPPPRDEVVLEQRAQSTSQQLFLSRTATFEIAVGEQACAPYPGAACNYVIKQLFNSHYCIVIEEEGTRGTRKSGLGVCRDTHVHTHRQSRNNVMDISQSRVTPLELIKIKIKMADKDGRWILFL